MDRPKRERKKPAHILPVPDPDELDLSGIEDDDSDGDFSSASSDEYNPNKSKNKSESESSLEEDVASSSEDDNEEEESPIAKNQPRTSQSCTKFGNRQNHVAMLRKEVMNKFKSSASQPKNQKLQDILKKAQFSKKSMFDGSESESDEPPDFDCNGGLELSDESESDSEQAPKRTKSTKTLKTTNNRMSSQESDSDNEQSTNNLKAVHDNLQKMRELAEKMAESSNKRLSNESQKENVNIADILAMGETNNVKSKPSKAKRKQPSQHDSDTDDWEEVEEDESRVNKATKGNVEIVLNDFGDNRNNKQVKPVDVEGQLKRKFNRIRKEQQEYLHKSQLVSWIGHGNFVNSRLNDIDLVKSVLKLLPNNKNQCYPRDKTDIDYFKQITAYYKQEMKLSNTEMYCERLKKRPPIMMSLALQMKFKSAICRRDYVLIYATLLRAIGIQCRVVQSIVCDPKVCPKSELMSLSKKPEKNSKKASNNSSNKSRSKSSSKKKSNKMKVPQLDGGDNDIPRNKRSARNDKYVNTPKKLRSSHTETFSPKVKIAVESPNRIGKPKGDDKLKNGSGKVSDAAKKSRAVELSKAGTCSTVFSPRKTRKMSRDQPTQSAQTNNPKENKAIKDIKAKAALDIFSPRKTRSKSRDEQPKPSTSTLATSSTKTQNDNKKVAQLKDSLKIVLPRTTRSRSRSADTAKPNLQKLALKRKADNQKDESSAPKIVKTEEQPSRKRKISKADEVEKKKPRVASEASDEDSLKYFKLNKSTSKKSANTSKVDRKVLSESEDEEVSMKIMLPKKSTGIDIWVEVYSEKDERWIAIDVFRGKVDCVSEIVKKATHPLVYVFAWNNDNSIKDVSARYCKDFNTRIRKMRVDRDYLNSVLNMYPGTRTSRDLKEDDELNKIQMKEGMPKSIAEFKNHPLYALKRHLLKYQAIYPPEPPILGYIRDEAIYPRDCVFILHTRETWLKEARVVKLNEKPYKMTTTLKWDKAKNKLLRDVPQELFGIWQTKDFEPPVAENGMVPRNAYGNVELFKACMLPIGTVHLQLPCLNRVCKKLGVDCAQAVVGFDSNGGWPFPVYDGFVVCEEFKEKVIDAWNRDRDEMEKKEQEKRDKRVYGNWKKLLKGLLIRERLKVKYNFEQK